MDINDQPEINHVPLITSYWVLPGKLLAGKTPKDENPNETNRNISRLLNTGITCFLDLTAEEERCEYENYLFSEADQLGIEVIHHRHPIKDFNTPSKVEMFAILDNLDAWLQDGRKVYLHCRGGAGRTGTVVGCYLVRHGLEGEAALSKLDELRQEVGEKDSSPETHDQKEMVRTWRQGW